MTHSKDSIRPHWKRPRRPDARPYTDGERRAVIAGLSQSDEAINLDARALIQGAYKQVGAAAPHPIPLELIVAGGKPFRGGIKPTPLALKRLLSDNVNLNKAGTRSLPCNHTVP